MGLFNAFLPNFNYFWSIEKIANKDVHFILTGVGVEGVGMLSFSY